MISISADHVSSVEPFSPWLHVSPQKPLHQLCSWKPAHTSNKTHTFNFTELFNKVGIGEPAHLFHFHGDSWEWTERVQLSNDNHTFFLVAFLFGTNLPSVRSASPKVRRHVRLWAARPTMAPHLGHPRGTPLVHPQTTQTLPQPVETQICTVSPKNW